jgi:hypothetical protein
VVVYGIRTMQERLYDSLARQRFSSTMLVAFAVFALLLAAVGLYGVMSHLVTQSTHDIGVLVTLGARPGNIIRLVVRQGMELAVIGIAVGLVGAAGLTGGGGVRRHCHSGMAGHSSGSHGRVARGINARIVASKYQNAMGFPHNSPTSAVISIKFWIIESKNSMIDLVMPHRLDRDAKDSEPLTLLRIPSVYGHAGRIFQE